MQDRKVVARGDAIITQLRSREIYTNSVGMAQSFAAISG